jgi:hypothetical protein
MSKADEDRARRLAEALRLNLRRRKAQARGGAAPDAGDPAPPGDADGDGAAQKD